MSIFAAQPSFIPPPSYTSTRLQPPPYKPTRSSPSISPDTPRTDTQPSLNQPPPTYKRSPSPSPSSQPHPPPYKPASNEEKSTSPSVWSPVTGFLSWIPLPSQTLIQVAHPSLSPASASLLSGTSSRTVQRRPEPKISNAKDDLYHIKEERRGGEGDGSDWCCGWFWIGPTMAAPWNTPYHFF